MLPPFRQRAIFCLIAFLIAPAALVIPSQADETPADRAIAETALPYAIMSGNAYARSADVSLAAMGLRRTPVDWEAVLSRTGYSSEQVRTLRAAGFDAALYRNDGTKEITVAFRGSDQLRDWAGVNLNARIRSFDLQYKAAADLASAVKEVWPKGTTISLTGHSLGGGLASYAAAKNPEITKVFTFNAARNPYSTAGTSSSQINIYVRDDVVGNPNNSTMYGRIAGSGALPGKSFYINSTTETLIRDPWLNRTVPDLVTTHHIDGVIGGLSAAKTNSVISPPVVVNRQQQSASAFGYPTTFSVGRSYSNPGGISFTKIAAERMPLHLDVDGVDYRDGRLIISGKRNSNQVLDAALVMTAFRAACEAGDPYFSLDPDNGQAWNTEGNRAAERLWSRVSKDIGWGTAVKADKRTLKSRSLSIRTIWGRRDYPQQWDSIVRDSPNFRSKLVFRPDWLRETRFGEILYKADVLLKELSSGVSILESGPLRAAKVDSYVPQVARSNAKSLFAGLREEKIQPQWRGRRLWFDIASPQERAAAASDGLVIRSPAERDLFNTLKERKVVAIGSSMPRPVHQVVKDGETLDLSNVYPTMFVRRHDLTSGMDLPDDDPIMNSLSADINDNIEKYVSAYRELQALTEIVRAYVVAVHVVKGGNWICQRIRDIPLFDSEKVLQPLPQNHPSELMISVERYAFGTGTTVRTLSALATLIQGGVAIAGKRFYDTSAIAIQTNVIAELRRELPTTSILQSAEPIWTAGSGRLFVMLNLRDDQDSAPAIHQSSAPTATGSQSEAPRVVPTEIEIENELRAQRLAAPRSEPDKDAQAARDYELAAQLSTAIAWQSFLTKHSTGFYADLAREHLKKLALVAPDTDPMIDERPTTRPQRVEPTKPEPEKEQKKSMSELTCCLAYYRGERSLEGWGPAERCRRNMQHPATKGKFCIWLRQFYPSRYSGLARNW